MKRLLILTLLALLFVGCSKKGKCKYDGHELKQHIEYGCYYEANGDIVMVDDSYCDCD